MEEKKKGYGFMLVLVAFLILVSISTLLPDKSASKDCLLLGYRAHCTFAPISTLICILVTVLAYMLIRKKFVEKK